MKIYKIGGMDLTAIDVAIECCHSDGAQDFYGEAEVEKVMAVVQKECPQVTLTERMAQIAVTRYNRAAAKQRSFYAH